VEKESRQKNLGHVYLEEVYLFSDDFKTATLVPITPCFKIFCLPFERDVSNKIKIDPLGRIKLLYANSYQRMAKKGATLYCEKNRDCRKTGYRSNQEGR
jgi:hypothetical protein